MTNQERERMQQIFISLSLAEDLIRRVLSLAPTLNLNPPATTTTTSISISTAMYTKPIVGLPLCWDILFVKFYSLFNHHH